MIVFLFPSFPVAALQAYKARLALLSASPSDIPEECLRLCDLASNSLMHSMDACLSGENSESIMVSIRSSFHTHL